MSVSNVITLGIGPLAVSAIMFIPTIGFIGGAPPPPPGGGQPPTWYTHHVNPGNFNRGNLVGPNIRAIRV